MTSSITLDRDRARRRFVLGRPDRNKAAPIKSRHPAGALHTLPLSITKLTGAIVPGPSVMMSRAAPSSATPARARARERTRGSTLDKRTSNISRISPSRLSWIIRDN